MGLLNVLLTEDEETLFALKAEVESKRFELTFESARNVLRAYLKDSCTEFNSNSSKEIFREAFESGLIQNGTIWMRAQEDRNKTTHKYDLTMLRQIWQRVKGEYIDQFNALNALLLAKFENEFGKQQQWDFGTGV